MLTAKMKLLLVCLLLPLALAAPADEKRLIFGALQIDNPFDLETLKCDVQIILDVVGSDPTEAACEKECNHIVTTGSILTHACPLVCHSVQNLAHYFHETPKPGDQHESCGGLGNIVGRK